MRVQEPNPRNTRGCCDGSGQVHHGEGALHYVTLCRDKACVERRELEWARECGEAERPTRALHEDSTVEVLDDRS